MSGVWQVSAGPTSRSYADLLLRHGVALIGPGDAGPWKPGRNDDDFSGNFVRRFACEIASGDAVLMRTGRSTVKAIGLVAGEYLHLNAFDDVNGWDLQHARRVHWCRLPQGYKFPSDVFGANPPRCSRVAHAEVLDFAQRFLNSPPTHWQTAPLPALPAEEPPLAEVPPGLAGLVAEAHDLVPLMEGGVPFGDLPSESELVGHFVVPFLRALGWAPELIGLEWRSVDVAVFRGLPRRPENCQFIIEAKRLGAGVEGALEQARRYVETLGLTGNVVVTDGIRYRMYDPAREFEPVAYANLVNLKQSAVHLFSKMQRN